MNEIKNKIKLIFKEIESVLLENEIENCENFLRKIISSKKIVTCGAGRVGYAIRAFCMRLGHFGFNAYHIGDTTVPRISTEDLFIVASGSGETKTILDLTILAKESGASILSVTGNPKSSISKLADININIKAPNKINKNIISQQPMTTLNEQCLFIFFDALVLMLLDFLDLQINKLGENHSLLE
jgi:6-phospho-3-hexuloisomerase